MESPYEPFETTVRPSSHPVCRRGNNPMHLWEREQIEEWWRIAIKK